MKTTSVPLALAVTLAIVGYATWQASVIERRVAAATRDLVAFRYDGPPTTLGDLPVGRHVARLVPGTGRTLEEAGHVQSTARYWSGQFAALEAEADDPFIAANAAYRALQRGGGPWRTAVGRLDGIITAYAEVMRQQPDNVDAAYNYELAVRVRDAIARAQVEIPPSPAAPASGDLPEGASVHGAVGAPPAGTDMKEYRMLVPMRPDERLDADEAGQGGANRKKG